MGTLQHIQTNLRGYFLLKKPVLNASFRFFGYMYNKNIILYGEFNEYEFKAKYFPKKQY